MSDIAESAVQDALVDRLTKPDLGWQYVAGAALDRTTDAVLIESEVVAALCRLNPAISEKPDRVDEVLPRLRATILAVRDDGLVESNRRMTGWLRGQETVRFVGTDDYVPVRLIDFDHPRANSLIVSTEVTYHPGTEERRYDVVLWVNGFPIVVGETKTPVREATSWLNAAGDIHGAYEVKTPGFYVPNVLSFATEGKEFRYGAVRQPAEMWLPWSRTTDELPLPGLASVLRSTELLLRPEMLLDIIRTYTLYSRRSSTAGGFTAKIIPRYPQVEAVEAIVARVRDPRKRQGLVWHHQGSGKTLVMAFAAARLRQQADLDAPTIVVVLDRLDLIEQVSSEFASVGLPGLRVAETKEDLRRLLREDSRGILVTTIFRFAEAGLLNERANIVVMVDEAHRTQEGRLGADMRDALPNAKFIGLTGTPISTDDRNTWETFGDPDDPGGVLNHYSVERSIADGATLPIHVETRLVDFHIDKAALDQAFAELAEAEALDEDQRGYLSRRASRVDTLMKTPVRIAAVCEDIVEHYRAKVAPLGLKAQVVAFDRELCVRYYDAISALLGPGEEATVVMTTAKDDPASWAVWDRDRPTEQALRDRFLDPADPLRFLIVTAKLLTGFDAPVEGVMYLDKPLRAHTLFQAVTRTNRRWTNPTTGQEKFYGLIVDYIGLGAELAKAVAVKDTGGKKALPADIEELFAILAAEVEQTMAPFASIDRTSAAYEQLMAAQEVLRSIEARADFAESFLRCEALFELLWPDTRLRPIEDDYRWLARIYASIRPSVDANALLWHRLGSKTRDLIGEYISGVEVEEAEAEAIAIDAGTFEALRQLTIFDDGPEPRPVPPTIDEVLDTVERRLRRKLAGPPVHQVWRALSERLEELRLAHVTGAKDSVAFLKRLLDLARQLVEAERAEADGRLDQFQVLDPDKGALTQILEEYAPPGVPVIVAKVVEDIDTLVRPIRGTHWQESQPGDREVRRQLRLILKNSGLPPSGDLYDRAYAYIREHY
ncbi:MAG TPA: HsdR family type I site-specific deoxyribonuclease [Propionibacteriaceae bacterium]|jgi:type I restriction enzyme R subunit